MFMSLEWSEETESRLVAAGWYKGRRNAQRVAEWRQNLETPNGFQMSLAAERALEEFGGLRVDCQGPGLECARGSFDLDPELASGEEERFDRFRAQVGSDLFPLGEAFDGQAFLAIDSTGRVYLIGDRVQLMGSSIRGALDSILMGRLPMNVD
ncbi:SUKH-3 domain-containing protein [Sorangium sp. So ce296]|uniref:SUKH-3 domain-containing protein n=1 Tax=Sorangium sp. So ce296 TaxID=3133296 RepID=UPI003F6401A3